MVVPLAMVSNCFRQMAVKENVKMITKKIKDNLTIKVRDNGRCSVKCPQKEAGYIWGEVAYCRFGKINGGKRHPDCIKAELDNANPNP